MFDIKTSKDFYEKLLQDFADFQAAPQSARLAVNCAITAYHLHEWVWGDWLKSDHATWAALGICDKKTFLAWLDHECPWFPLMQEICNGSKHFNRRASQRTKVAGGFDSSGFDAAAFDTQHLEIEAQVHGVKKWIAADIVIEEVVRFWRDFLRQHSPFKNDMPTSRAHFTEFKL